MKDNKKKKDVKGWLIKNRYSFIFGIIGLLVGMLAMLIMWPERIATLKNGEQTVVSVDGLTITANDLYEKMKENQGLTTVLETIDKALLKKEYNLEDEAASYAKETAENYYQQYETYYGYTKEQFLESNNFENEDAFLDYLKFDYYGNKYYQDYLKSLIKDKDIEKFYKKEAFGEKEVILLSSSEEENSLEKIRTALKKGTSIDDLKEKYEDVVANELTISMSDISTYSKDIILAIKNLKKDSYTKVIKDDNYGEVVIYVTSAKKLGSLEDEKDNIINAISARMDSEDQGLYKKSYDALRIKYHMEFKDTNMAKEYKTFIKN